MDGDTECKKAGAATIAPDVPPPNSLPSSSTQDRNIVLVMKRLPEAREALVAHNNPPRIFERNGDLVILRQSADGQSLMPLSISDLQCELAYAARWYEQGEKDLKPVFPPSLVVRDLMRKASEWAPVLRDIVHVPVFGKDWRLLQEPGYHKADQLLYVPDHGSIPSVGTHPTRAQVRRARGLLFDELLGQFPFNDCSQRAAVIAAAIVPFVRGRIEGSTPLHLIDSPGPGTGKTLLADVVSILALGREPAANTEIASADDLRKWVTAMALSGEEVILIDNINDKLHGSALAAALTKVQWCDRIVGTSRLARGVMRSLWLATGNNVTVSPEIARRLVRCRLDAGMQRPNAREGFRHPDLRGWAKAHRNDLIWAVLTLTQRWVAAGCPDGQRSLASFESYSRIIGGILHTAGVSGFMESLVVDQQRGDDETIEWVAFISAWHERFGTQRVGAEELDREILAVNPEMLAGVLINVSSERGRRIKIGQALRRRRDAVFGGLRINVSDNVDRHGCWSYALEEVTSTIPRRRDNR